MYWVWGVILVEEGWRILPLNTVAMASASSSWTAVKSTKLLSLWKCVSAENRVSVQDTDYYITTTAATPPRRGHIHGRGTVKNEHPSRLSSLMRSSHTKGYSISPTAKITRGKQQVMNWIQYWNAFAVNVTGFFWFVKVTRILILCLMNKE